MSNRTSVLKRVQKQAMAEYRKQGKSWTKAAHAIGISRGTLIRIAHGYEPKWPSIRRILGLPIHVVLTA